MSTSASAAATGHGPAFAHDALFAAAYSPMLSPLLLQKAGPLETPADLLEPASHRSDRQLVDRLVRRSRRGGARSLEAKGDAGGEPAACGSRGAGGPGRGDIDARLLRRGACRRTPGAALSAGARSGGDALLARLSRGAPPSRRKCAPSATGSCARSALAREVRDPPRSCGRPGRRCARPNR